MFFDLGKIQTNMPSTKNPEGKGFHIKITEDIEIHITGTTFKGEKIDRVLRKGDFINVEDERERIKRLNKNSPDKVEERLSKLPAFVKYNLSVAPPKEIESNDRDDDTNPTPLPNKKRFTKNK